MTITDLGAQLKFTHSDGSINLLNKFGLNIVPYRNGTIGFINGGIELSMIVYSDVTSPSTLTINDLMILLSEYLTGYNGIADQSFEIIAPGNTGRNQNGNWKWKVNETTYKLEFQKYKNDSWVTTEDTRF